MTHMIKKLYKSFVFIIYLSYVCHSVVSEPPVVVKVRKNLGEVEDAAVKS